MQSPISGPEGVELRSDTFTLPTQGMMEAMMAACPGDDVFREDGPTRELEEFAARFFGFESALFCVSGTMSNQIALHQVLRPGDEIVCDALSHVYLYEGGGLAANSHAQPALLQGDRGRLTASQILSVIKPDDPHFPVTRAVSLENTVNKGGGACYDLQELRQIAEVCRREKLHLHLDGARLCNALVARQSAPADTGQLFDSASVCLSKGLGAPMGSVLLGSESFIAQARRIRKRWGGGWRQSGFMAAAGLYALRFQYERLAEDHARALALSDLLQGRSWVKEMLPVETNIVLFRLEGIPADVFCRQLAAQGIRVSAPGPGLIRLVTHLGVSWDDVARFEDAIRNTAVA